MEKVTVTKVKINDEIFYVKGEWDENVIVTLINKDQIWNGIFSEDKIQHFYTNLSMTKDQYMKNVIRVLSGNIEQGEFLFGFDNNVFVWKKVEKTTGLKIQHGSVNMDEYSPSGGTELIADILLEIKNAVENELKTKDNELNDIARELSKMKKKMEEGIDLKMKMEEELYVKFLALLNTKKQKIANLEEFINEFGNGNNNSDRALELPNRNTSVSPFHNSG